MEKEFIEIDYVSFTLFLVAMHIIAATVRVKGQRLRLTYDKKC